MILVSNHLLRAHSIDIAPEAVIRINVAWCESVDQLNEYLDIPHDVFLDYPTGRTKPPVPTITLDCAIRIAAAHSNVKWFAVSNASTAERVGSIRRKLPLTIQLVPKIENEAGVYFIEKIVEAAQCTHIMLDKEDLFVNVKHAERYSALVDVLRRKCGAMGVNVFELAGVIFDETTW